MPYPYTQTTKLPEEVRRVLPPPARLIYQAAFNSAWNQYKHRFLELHEGIEELSHRLAWQAVGQSYEADPSSSRWRPKR